MHTVSDGDGTEERVHRLESLSRVVLSLGSGRLCAHQSADRITQQKQKQLEKEKELLNQMQIQVQMEMQYMYNQPCSLGVSLSAEKSDSEQSIPSVSVPSVRVRSVKALADILRQLIAEGDAGPLSMMQLARIAVRSQLGGVRFGARVSLLPLPPSLKEYLLAVPLPLPLPVRYDTA